MANPFFLAVPGAGIEPTWMQDPLDFESEGSTHYAIRNFYYKLL